MTSYCSAARYVHIPTTRLRGITTDLASSDFHLFGPLKEFLGGQHFSTDDEVKQGVPGWFRRTNKSLYAKAVQALVKRWYKCINVTGLCRKIIAVFLLLNFFIPFYKLRSSGWT